MGARPPPRVAAWVVMVSAGLALAQSTPDLTTASWAGWNTVGQSDQVGIYARSSTAEVYSIHTSLFVYDGGIPGTLSGFDGGNRIFGLGVQRVMGTSDLVYIQFDFDNGSYTPATSLAAADGQTSFPMYGSIGDAVVSHGLYGGPPSEITIKATPTNYYLPCGVFGCGNGIPGIRGLRFGPGHFKMFYDLTHMPVRYPALAPIGRRLTIAIGNGQNESVFTIDLQDGGTNVGPVAVDDRFEVSAGGLLAVAAPGVLGNDSDANGDPLRAIQDSAPLNGTLTLLDDGSFTYTPFAGFVGADSFRYKATDGIVRSQVVTVSISVDAGAMLDAGEPPDGGRLEPARYEVGCACGAEGGPSVGVLLLGLGLSGGLRRRARGATRSS